MILLRISFSPGNVAKALAKLLFLVPCIFMTSCFENPTRPVVTTSPITNLQTSGSATTGGIILSDGKSEIFQKGICMSTHALPSISDGPSNEGGGNGSFETSILLSPGVTYYIRAYAANGAGIGYGNEVSISIVGVTLIDLTAETGTTAFVHGSVVSDQPISSHGVCWSTSDNPTIDNSKTDEGVETGVFTSEITGLSPGITYYVRAYAVSANNVFYSGSSQVTTIAIPTLTTKAISNAGTFIINTGGDLISFQGVLNSGVCWSTNPQPTVEDNKTNDSPGFNSTTSFFSQPSELQPGITYYIRAYATNVAGTGYGNQRSITMPLAVAVDVDGHPYSSITIGTEVWLVENLRTTKFSNGDPISQVTNDTDLRNTNSPDWMYYAYDAQFDFPYGKLYNWYTITDARNVCPTGWHVPSDDEWMIMMNYEGGISSAEDKILEEGQIHWASNNSSDNSSGLTILPGGGQGADSFSFALDAQGLFWTTTSSDTDNAWSFNISDFNKMIYHQVNLKKSGFSVRCIKD